MLLSPTPNAAVSVCVRWFCDECSVVQSTFRRGDVNGHETSDPHTRSTQASSHGEAYKLSLSAALPLPLPLHRITTTRKDIRFWKNHVFNSLVKYEM